MSWWSWKNSMSYTCYADSMEGAVSACAEAKDFIWEAGHGLGLPKWLGLEKCWSRTIAKAKRLRWQWARQTRLLLEKSGRWSCISRGPYLLGLVGVLALS